MKMQDKTGKTLKVGDYVLTTYAFYSSVLIVCKIKALNINRATVKPLDPADSNYRSRVSEELVKITKKDNPEWFI